MRWWRTLSAVVLVAAVAAQVRVWLFDRGLWHDELYVAYNLQHKNFVQLAGGLYWNQTAPPGWLVIEKTVYELFGGSEYLLRLPQLLAGLATLALTMVIGVKAIGRWGGLLAAALAGISPMLLYYSGELKQYAGESCAALAIMLLAHSMGRRLIDGTATRRDFLIFSGGTAIAMGITYSGVIALGGCLLAILALLARERKWRTCLFAILAALPALVIGGLQVILLKRVGAFLPNLDQIYFPNGTPGDGSIFSWLPRLWPAFVQTPLYWSVPLAVLAIAVVGLAGLWNRGQQLWAAIFGGLFVAALGAAAVNGLPMVNRISLYLVAPMLLLIAAGVDYCIRIAIAAIQAKQYYFVPIAAFVVFLTALAAVPFVQAGAAQVAHPRTVAPYQPAGLHPDLDNGRAIMRQVKEQWQPGDVILSYSYAQPLVSWYSEQYGLAVAGYADISPACPSQLSSMLGPAKRVWYVHLEQWSGHPADVHSYVLHELTLRGTLTNSHEYGPDGAWALIDLTAGPDPHPIPSGPHPLCLVNAP